jgi:hypothetical protein
MLLAMAYVVIREDLRDQEFIDTYTLGFDKFKDCITSVEDGLAKTPARGLPWSSWPRVTGGRPPSLSSLLSTPSFPPISISINILSSIWIFLKIICGKPAI